MKSSIRIVCLVLVLVLAMSATSLAAKQIVFDEGPPGLQVTDPDRMAPPPSLELFWENLVNDVAGFVTWLTGGNGGSSGPGICVTCEEAPN